ncbi:MAG: ATP-binding cassette domain-containing protein [bacterium]|nr:ATP-binding cassette domain-containing protein [bacterium]
MMKTKLVETHVEPTPPAGLPEPADDLLVIEGLKVVRGRGEETFLVDVPELRIARGSFTSILGSSGCGKTSLLMVLGLLRGSEDDSDFRITCRELSFHLATPMPGFPDRKVTIYREIVDSRGGERLPAARIEELRQRLIGFCLQGGELVPSLTLAENVAVPARLGGHPEPGRRAAESLTALQMSDQLHKLPGELSGGQGQRGVLARALVHEPALVILDEPTSSLDRRTAESAIQLLQERARERGQTIVMVTHDPALARRFSDHIVSMGEVGLRRGGIVTGDNEGSDEAGPEKARISRPDPPRGDRAPGALGTGAPPPDPPPLRGDGPLPPRRSPAYYLRLALLDAVGPLGSVFAQALRERARAFRRGSRLRNRTTYTFLLQLIKGSLVAVAIGLLILLLRGVRSGLVEDFRQSLLQSPTARELVITPLMATGALTRESLDELAGNHPEIDLVLPQSTHVVSLANPPTAEDSLTLAGTVARDPKLVALHGDQDFSTFGSDSLVVSSALAAELKLVPGSELTVWVSRDLDADGRQRETSPAVLEVSNVIEGGDRKSAYAHLALMDQIASYKAGRPVPERDWPGFVRPVSPRYAAYLLFAKRPLSGREERILKSRGLEAELLEATDPRAALNGRFLDAATLEERGKSEISIYAVLSGRQEEDLRWLDPGIAEVERLLIDSDGILLPWNDPLPAKLGGEDVTLVGLSASSRWLKGYLRHRRGIFPASSFGWEATFADRKEEKTTATLELGDLALEVEVHERSVDAPVAAAPAVGPPDPPATADPVADADPPTATQAPAALGPPPDPPATADPAAAADPPAASQAPPLDPPRGTVAPPLDPSQETVAPCVEAETVAVPASLLAHLHMAAAGLAVADPEQHLFRPVSEESSYYQARVFVRDVFQVADLHERLATSFGVRSNQARVREVQSYSEVLGLLVGILSVMALGIALFTIYVVFHDVSVRKKRMIGTLRILGLPPVGVLVLLWVRALLVALAASGLIFVFGQALAAGLNAWYAKSLCLLVPQDYLWVMLWIVVVCLLAVLPPAWKISRLDPVVALEEGKLSA